MSHFQMNGCLMSHLCPAHWTCSFSVEPCRDAFFTEDVFAVKHGRFLDAVVTNRTHATSVGFQVLVAWTRTITLKNELTFEKNNIEEHIRTGNDRCSGKNGQGFLFHYREFVSTHTLFYTCDNRE